MKLDNRPDVLILAGGLGMRLREVVNDRPKPLAAIRGRPFVALLFEQLVRFDYRRAILCVGYRGEQVQAEFGDRQGALALEYSFEAQPLGTGGALRNAADLVRTPEVLVMNGDSFCEIDLAAFLNAHRSFGGEGTIAVLHREDRSRSGAVEIDDGGRVTSFAGRPDVPNAGLINAGVYLLRRELLLTIPSGRAVSLENEIFPEVTARRGLFGWRVGPRFIDIGTPDDYRAAQKFFSD
jgi:D-glycero-alpha-D-manno-heptose 1-phosphate guanylyltransferase